jgi:heme-degrading monooxygenase HmoA
MPGMAQAKDMIVRTWSATADAAGAGNYGRYFAGSLLPQLRELPGFAGAYLLRRDLGEDGTVELTTHTFWESAAAVRAFVGDDLTLSVVEPEARAMLLDFDRTAAHRSVVIDARG